MEGRRVYLCWKLGEPEVLYWHDLEAGFQGRQPLTAGSVAESSDPAGENLDAGIALRRPGRVGFSGFHR